MSRLAIGLFVLDIAGFLGTFSVVYWLELEKLPDSASLPLAGILFVQLIMLYVFDLYSVNLDSSRLGLVFRVVAAVVITGMVMAGVVYITKTRDTEQLFFRGVLAGGFTAFLTWTVLNRYLAAAWARRRTQQIRWLVVSDIEPDSPLGRDVALVSATGSTTILVPELEKAGSLPGELTEKVAGSFKDFEEFVDTKWSGIVIATEHQLPNDLLRRIMELRLAGVRIYDLTDFYEQYMQKIPVLHLRDNWFALSHGFDLLHHNVQLKIKRILDIGLSIILLIITSPIMVLVAVAIKSDRRATAKGPVIYRQLRTGMNGQQFYIYKFRTMVNNAEEKGPKWATDNDERITRVGGLLRKCRLDELPQLWNVLKGEMSFVGPRPERPDFNEELEKEIPYYDLRHLIKPGITGWAQVKYKYGSSKADALEKLQYDIYYIKNYSLLLDLIIVLKTFRVILGRRGR